VCGGERQRAVLGFNLNGQLGNNSIIESHVPVTAIASGATAISVGGGFACAVVSGSGQCWGFGVTAGWVTTRTQAALYP